MIQEPTITIPVLGSGPEGRRQFVTTMSLRSILLLVAPVIQRTDRAAGFRMDRLAAKKIADEWKKRGDMESLKPIVIAISGDCRYVPLEDGQRDGPGQLVCPLNAILDVCDGIQRLAAIKQAMIRPNELRENEWPVHLVQANDSQRLEEVTTMVRNQTAASVRRNRPRAGMPDVDGWMLDVVAASPLFRKAVALKKSSLPSHSGHLWTGSAVRKAFVRLVADGLVEPTPTSAATYARIWGRICQHVDLLRSYQDERISACHIRQHTVLPQAPAFHSLAVVAALLVRSTKKDADVALDRLGTIDWTHNEAWMDIVPKSACRLAWTHKILAACGLAQPVAVHSPE